MSCLSPFPRLTVTDGQGDGVMLAASGIIKGTDFSFIGVFIRPGEIVVFGAAADFIVTFTVDIGQAPGGAEDFPCCRPREISSLYGVFSESRPS